jgi:uncharacterized protein
MASRVETWQSPDTRTGPSHIQGKGMFAIVDIAPGAKLVVWGDGYTDAEGARDAQARGLGTMQWDEDLFSFENDADDDPYSVNHSCDPNAWMSDAHTLTALRPIAAGEEITLDYALFEADEDCVSEWTCGCGFEQCRGRITGMDWRIPELQDRYRHHFSPLINKRIARLGSAQGDGTE